MSEASPWLERWAHLLPANARSLDLACGHGRHTRWLLAHGATVTAIDRDAAALASLPAAVRRIEADIENGPWPLPDDSRFDAVIVTNYLHRPLLLRIAKSVAPGGILLYETFAQGNERFGKPSNPAFLLAPGELLTLADAAGLRVVAYEDGVAALPREACVQRLCAVRPAPGEAAGHVALYELRA
ncbi:SAM-dependent methyltransferase [Pandoraea terrae]|uniref:SAM-dependent methyltransferase n=1 Tax=Pandoraea terrae TaxID=1537710 RepID=A0A5E4VUC6_9BURK|nr:class I SAM-dependent methyltransferase [Pandoraea terrae]VVE14620.1 SAM-dependent methyltransferase [Pandoraea terrae]